MRPHARKVTHAPLGLAPALVIMWVAGLFEVPLPEEVAMAMVTIFSYLIGWLVPEEAKNVDISNSRTAAPNSDPTRP